MKRLETMSFQELMEYGDKLERLAHIAVFGTIIFLIAMVLFWFVNH